MFGIACAKNEPILVKYVCEKASSPCSGPTPAYQDMSTRHDWPIKKAIVDLPIRMKGNSNALSVLGCFPWAGPEQRSRRCCAEVTNQEKVTC